MSKIKSYWLMKSEPDAYSIDDLEREYSALQGKVRDLREYL